MNWDEALEAIQCHKNFAGVVMGSKLYFRCGTYEKAEEARKILMETGFTLTTRGLPDINIAPDKLNWKNIVILPE